MADGDGDGDGVDWCGVSGHGPGACSAGGVDCCLAGIGVDGRSGGGIDRLGLWGVVCDGAEAWGLIDLCYPFKPRRFVQRRRVRHGAGCR